MLKKVVLILFTMASTLVFFGCGNTVNDPVAGKLYVNDALVDTTYTGFIERGLFKKPVILIPVCKLFEGMGYNVNWCSDTCAELTKGDSIFFLDLDEQSLKSYSTKWDQYSINYIGLFFEDDDPADLMMQVVDHDIVVNLNYVRDRGFKALYIDMDIRIDNANKTVSIYSDGIYHPLY